MATDAPAVGKGLDAAATADCLADAIRQLSQPLQETLLLRYYGEMSIAEVAETLDISPGTVKSRLFSATGPAQETPSTRTPAIRCGRKIFRSFFPNFSSSIGNSPFQRARIMTCEDCQSACYDLLDRSLTAKDERDVLAHIGTCPQCRQFLEEERRRMHTWPRLLGLAARNTPLPPDAVERITHALEVSHPNGKSHRPLKPTHTTHRWRPNWLALQLLC
jgi:hypothetical protein